MSATAARALAREAVTRVRERSAYAHETVNSLLTQASLSERDAAFASRLAFGTISCRGTVDEAVADHVRDVRSLEPRVGDCLAMSAYELLFMRTPVRAAVSEGVELVRSVQPKAAGLANAVLRRLSDRRDGFPWGDPTTDLAALARLHGHPQWMAELLVRENGRETAENIMRADNEPAPLYLGLLPFKAHEDEILEGLVEEGAIPVTTGVEGCVLAEAPSAAISASALTEGYALVADASAQYAASVVPLHDGATVAESGAGRGTKTLLMAARAHRRRLGIRFLAIDVHEFKLEQLRQASARVGAPPIELISADATTPDMSAMPQPGSVDCVLVDAPCSGLGTLRRHPDRRWRAREEEIEAVAGLGARMLRAAAVLVKPGGFVVYSTCTITRCENDVVVNDFLESTEGRSFVNDDLAGDTPPEFRHFVSDSGRFQSLPKQGGPDGHFVARLVRQM